MNVTEAQRITAEAWAHKTLEAADTLDTNLYASRFASDANLKFGNDPTLEGREAFKAWHGAQTHGLKLIVSLIFRLLTIDVLPNKTIITTRVHYKFKEVDEEVVVPVMGFWLKSPEEAEARGMEAYGDFGQVKVKAFESMEKLGLLPPRQ
ncbi:hypothetical protein BT69DRAFT_1297672 [Atractiella rhizophila]|nr:hypothetical protein BT69DRAFT_1297672 [Atractiella rhizophila]